MKRILSHSGAAVGGALALVLTVGVAAYASGDNHRGEKRAERIDHMFEVLDANADGAIDKAEVESAKDARFAAADTNSDGTLTVSELEAAAAKRAEKRVARMVERLDANQDGALDTEEFAAAAKKRGSGHGAKMFKRFDADGDGRVTREEADAHMAAHHKKHDG